MPRRAPSYLEGLTNTSQRRGPLSWVLKRDLECTEQRLNEGIRVGSLGGGERARKREECEQMLGGLREPGCYPRSKQETLVSYRQVLE